MKTHPLRSLAAACLATVAFSVSMAQTPTPPKIEFPQPSPTATLKQRVGLADIEVVYSRPSMRDRRIFGGPESLVPYGQVWRTGANSATKITFSTAVKFGGADVPAGTYALFTIPETSEWTVILNKVTGQWGAYRYDQANDVVRVKATSVTLGETIETFTIGLNDLRDDSATLNLSWERTRVPVKLQFDVVPVVLKQIGEAEAAGRKFSPGESVGAAVFFLEHNLDLKKALGWLDAAIAEQPTAFYLHYYKAKVLAKQGDLAGAKAASEKSVEAAKAQGGAVADEYVRLNKALLDSLAK